MEINTNNLLVEITKVKPNTYNPKLDFESNDENKLEYEKIKQSLKVAGQIQPVLVRELEDGTFEIINGYHRWRAMQELGSTQIEVKNLGKIDFDTAVSRALLTEDTKIPIDAIELAELLKKIVSPDKPIDYWANILPYSSDLIKSKIDLLEYNFDKFNPEEGGVDLKDLAYVFKCKDEAQLAKIRDYFDQFPKEERIDALLAFLSES